jgi:quercetin dioxygenase-like cupin family protein
MRRSSLVTLLVVFASFAVVGTVLATHTPSFPNTTTASARGTLAAKVKLNLGNIKVQTKGPIDVVTAEVTFAAGSPTGATAGWHSHPGAVFVVIRSGTLSVWDKTCVKHTYGIGDSFFEAGPGESLLVKNESTTTDAKAYATFLVPVGATPLRIGRPHLCGLAE